MNGLRVEVAFSPAAGQVERVSLRLPEGSTVDDALRASGLPERHGLAASDLRVGVWGRVCAPERPLRDGDRVEVYRPLTVDPKEARRLRQRRQPARPRKAVSGNPTR